MSGSILVGAGERLLTLEACEIRPERALSRKNASSGRSAPIRPGAGTPPDGMTAYLTYLMYVRIMTTEHTGDMAGSRPAALRGTLEEEP